MHSVFKNIGLNDRLDVHRSHPFTISQVNGMVQPFVSAFAIGLLVDHCCGQVKQRVCSWT